MANKEDKDLLQQEDVRKAQEQLRTQLRPGGYQSQWQAQLDDTMKRIMNREKFTYDLNGDALYRQYKDRYITGGKMAMMDTMGQAAALTGGYGNSYAQGVGQQAYQGYLQGLNDKIPELYQLALDSYDREGDALMQQYGLLQDREAQDYGMFQDNMALVQPQVLEMIQNGVMPSDELLRQSGLSKEYLQMLMANGGLAQQGDDGRWYVAQSSDWFQNNLTSDGWINTTDGKRWLNTREGQGWLAGLNDVANADEGKAVLTGILNDPDTTSEKKREMLNALQGYK